MNDAPLAGLRVRRASRADLPRLLELIADDMLGKNREGVGSDDPLYEHAFEAIDRDANQYLMLAELDGRVIGMLQLTFIPGLSRRGAWRATSSRCASTAACAAKASAPGSSGEHSTSHAAAVAGSRSSRATSGCTEAHRFYGQLGFSATHEGYKRELEAQ